MNKKIEKLNEVIDINGSKVFVENGEVKSGYMSVEEAKQLTMAEMTKIDQLQEVISESVKEVLSLYEEIVEGIDINPQTRTVSFNPNHEENVDASVENSPICDTDLIPGVDVWSIFQRKRNTFGDCNPLTCALKGEGWKISGKDRKAIERRFHAMAEKFASLDPIGITILIPGGNYLNDYMARVVASKSKDVQIITGIIRNMTTEEVDDIVLYDDNCVFRKFYGNNFNVAYEQLRYYLEAMNKQRGVYFTRHFIKNEEMRNVLDRTLVASDDPYARFAKKITGQNILVIDDTISRDQSIQEACKIMQETYAPESITVLTLLPKLN